MPVLSMTTSTAVDSLLTPPASIPVAFASDLMPPCHRPSDAIARPSVDTAAFSAPDNPVAVAWRFPEFVSTSWPPPRSMAVAELSAVDFVLADAAPLTVTPTPNAPDVAFDVAVIAPVFLMSSFPLARISLLS
jgi:hypothetical protein